MELIRKITDEDFGLENKEMINPRIRYGARGIILRETGEIAILNKQVKNEFKLVGGGIDKGEDPQTAFKREVMEETGCEVEIIRTLGTIEEHKSHDNFKQISYVFVAKVIKEGSTLNLTKKEMDEGSKLLWFNVYEALEKIKNCEDNLKESSYENIYHSKFIVLRDQIILEYYLQLL
ncbi:MAG: NUDIX domain-containing protein [Mycoplasmatota bacterium]